MNSIGGKVKVKTEHKRTREHIFEEQTVEESRKRNSEKIRKKISLLSKYSRGPKQI